MDDSGHELKASAPRDISAHWRPCSKPASKKERERRKAFLQPPSDSSRRIEENLGSWYSLPLTYEDQPEDALVEWAEQGDDEAFSVLSMRYNKPICRYIFRLITNSEVAAELTQEAFLKAWQALPGRDQKRPLHFRAWLYRIAYTTTMDYLRKYSQESLISLEDEKSSQLTKNISWAEKVEISLCKQESIIAALKHVYPQYRQCIILRYVYEQSFQEIAQTLNIDEGTVRAHISRGRRQFTQAYLREMNNDRSQEDMTREGEM